MGPPWLSLLQQYAPLLSQLQHESMECVLYYLVGWREEKGLSNDPLKRERALWNHLYVSRRPRKELTWIRTSIISRAEPGFPIKVHAPSFIVYFNLLIKLHSWKHDEIVDVTTRTTANAESASDPWHQTISVSAHKNLKRIPPRLTNGGSLTNNSVLRSLFKTIHTISVWFYVW